MWEMPGMRHLEGFPMRERFHQQLADAPKPEGTVCPVRDQRPASELANPLLEGRKDSTKLSDRPSVLEHHGLHRLRHRDERARLVLNTINVELHGLCVLARIQRLERWVERSYLESPGGGGDRWAPQ